MAMVKPMPLAETLEALQVSGAQGGAGVEQAIGNIGRPGREDQQERDPCRQTDLRRPCERERPDHGDSGSIEAGQMPEAQGSRRVPSAACGGDSDCVIDLR